MLLKSLFGNFHLKSIEELVTFEMLISSIQSCLTSSIPLKNKYFLKLFQISSWAAYLAERKDLAFFMSKNEILNAKFKL